MQVYKVNIDHQFITDLVNSDEKYVLDPLKNNTDELKKLIESALGFKIKITNSWLNKTEYTENEDNSFPWHNEKGTGGTNTNMPGTHAAILWIAGEANKGGSLEVMLDHDIESIDFESGKLITFESDTLHKVSHYYGTIPRTSINITYEELGDAD
jgi:predicted 2-oxoglutarate/Fe(II)-dependent dioxygenase YbiX